ncbi:hypothetical protein EMCRGX_G030449 [Ephydatia muelleri]
MVQNAWSWGGPAFWQLEKGGPGNVFKAANHLAITMSSPKPTVLADIYSRLNITLEVPSWHGILFLHDFMCAFIVITCKNNNKQYGVACPAGAEKVIRGVRSCIQEHWKDDNFTVCKVDMSNAFNLVSRQALLEECAVHFQELLPWFCTSWCYPSHRTRIVYLYCPTDGTLTMVFVRTLSGYYPGGDSHSRDGSIFGAVYQCSKCLNLHLEPNEFQVAIKWWLGMDVSFGSCWPYCPNHRLDPLGHYALTCKHGGGQVEVGSGLGLDRLHSHPADVLVNWHLGKPAAFDLTVTSPLNPITLTEAGVRCGSSALFAEARKHNANDSKCAELGWVCIPLAVESYGCWGTEAQQSFSCLAARLAIQTGCSK